VHLSELVLVVNIMDELLGGSLHRTLILVRHSSLSRSASLGQGVDKSAAVLAGFELL